MNKPQKRFFFTNMLKYNRMKPLLVLLILLPFLQSCGLLYPNRILKTDKDYVFQSFLDSIPQDFIIEQGDQIEVYVYPKKGYILIEPQISTSLQNNPAQSIPSFITYLVDYRGESNLPIVGLVKLSGLTEREAEEKLVELYTPFYIDPFVNVNITNKSLTVYRGSAEAREVIMMRPDITVLEAIGLSGGMPVNAKSKKVRVLRNYKGENMIEALDLSDLSDLPKAQSYILPNDVIYIEPGINAEFFSEISPIVTTASSLIVIYAFFINLNSK